MYLYIHTYIQIHIHILYSINHCTSIYTVTAVISFVYIYICMHAVPINVACLQFHTRSKSGYEEAHIDYVQTVHINVA